MDGRVQVILERNIYGQDSDFEWIGFAEGFLAPGCVGVGIGGDCESLMGVRGSRVGF